ncbi:MAG TPA: glycosyltransferase family 4 protein [Candidatus Omnitrophota bacterium]|nr:glycosyltransferase family 4 protein [Candidatus Omnitrophota bacterium]HPD84320.1 glycosyltransferase family 4 protein [Candidatus Omnitrophota bacterium]HRZ03178.1 glycosyltransferase family 4 protein [Candidatus Omnitrophota bacterium]
MNKTEREPVKILHLHTRAIVGGSSTNVVLTLKGLPKERFSAELACGSREAQDAFIDSLKEGDIKFHFIPHLINRINPVYDCLALFEMICLIKNRQYAIVHTHNSKAGILGRLAAKLCKVPVIIHTIHSCEFNYSGVGPLAKRFFIFLERWAAHWTDYFIAISPHIKSEFIRYRIAPSDKISVILSGIEIEKFRISVDRDEKRKELGIGPDRFIVGAVARMEEGKGYEYLLQAAAQILRERKDIVFLLIGDGPLKRKLEQKVKNDNIQSNVLFAGLRLDVPELLKIMDVFCLPSLYEGMGRVILEAQAAGKAVVAMEAGGIADIVNKNKTAILLMPKDVSALEGVILRLVQDHALRGQMGQEAVKFVDGRFSSATMVSEIRDLYETFLSKQ